MFISTKNHEKKIAKLNEEINNLQEENDALKQKRESSIYVVHLGSIKNGIETIAIEIKADEIREWCDPGITSFYLNGRCVGSFTHVLYWKISKENKKTKWEYLVNPQ